MPRSSLSRSCDIDERDGKLYSYRPVDSPRCGEVSAKERRDAELRLDARERANRLFAAAVREGRHAPTQTVCDGCSEWCDGIYYITFGKQRLCATCADTLAGAGPEAVRKQREGASYVPPRPPQQHTRPAPQGAREPAGTDAPHGRGAAKDGGSFSRVPQVSCQEAEW